MRPTSVRTPMRDVPPVRPVRGGARKGNPFADRATYLLAFASFAASYLLPDLAMRLLSQLSELRR
jgi:hypothetical protein